MYFRNITIGYQFQALYPIEATKVNTECDYCFSHSVSQLVYIFISKDTFIKIWFVHFCRSLTHTM